MKKGILFLLALTFLPSDALAQVSGVVNISGRVEKAAAIRWWSFAPINGEAGVNAPATQNAALDFQLDLADVAAGNNPTNFTGGTAQMMVRSNAPFTLTAQVSSNTGFGTVAAGDLALSDVGFGIAALANSGPKVFADPAGASGIAPAFDYDPASAAKDVDEEPSFSASLADLSGGFQVLGGPRISNRGGVNSPNNGLLIDTVYAIGPQFYTPVDPFSATVTYTLATP